MVKGQPSCWWWSMMFVRTLELCFIFQSIIRRWNTTGKTAHGTAVAEGCGRVYNGFCRRVILSLRYDTKLLLAKAGVVAAKARSKGVTSPWKCLLQEMPCGRWLAVAEARKVSRKQSLRSKEGLHQNSLDSVRTALASLIQPLWFASVMIWINLSVLSFCFFRFSSWVLALHFA